MAIRPPELVYAVDERPPAARLAVLGLQYGILVAVYLIIIAIVAGKAGATPDTTRNLVSLASSARQSARRFRPITVKPLVPAFWHLRSSPQFILVPPFSRPKAEARPPSPA